MEVMALPNTSGRAPLWLAVMMAASATACTGQIDVGRTDSGETINTGNGKSDDDADEDGAASSDDNPQAGDDEPTDDGEVVNNDDGEVTDGDETDAERPGFRLTWQEEFEGAAGSGPDGSRWRHDVGTGWGNGQLEFDTDRTENAAHDGGGNLVITARQESFQGSAFTSARLTTSGVFTQAYGRFEARMKLPFGQGIWPAFWLLGENIGDAGWPQCGEIDIMENLGQDTTRMYGTIHGPGYSGGDGIGATFDLNGGQSFDDGFHVFAVEWEPNVVRWYVDDSLYQTRTPSDLPGGTQWVYDHPFFIILNLAVGGQFPGNPDGSTTFPQALLVDYVRVYEKL
jgi:beta-glucanase (GH16 family)